MLNLILSSCIITIFMMYIFKDMLGIQETNKTKIIISYIILTIITCASGLLLNSAIRIMCLCLVFSFYIMIVYKESFKKAILTTLFYEISIMLAETIFLVGITLTPSMEPENLFLNPLYMLLINIVIPIINVIILKLPFVRKIYNYLIRITFKINIKKIIFISMTLILIANFLTGILYYKVEIIYLSIFSGLLTLFCFCIILYSFNAQNKYIKIYDKYNNTLNSLKEYENILDKYRIINHENKNELLTIRNMLDKKDRKITSYIDTIIDNKLKDNSKIMNIVSKVPMGGLRGLIYSKILLIEQHKIKYNVYVSRNLKVKMLSAIDDELVLDVCKIIGVFLDNAIEETKNIKDAMIDISMLAENNNLIISISNTFSNKIELEKLDNKGYSTKGNNRGYGLSLVREIINNNSKIKNIRKINNNVFTQEIKIKL